MTVTGTGFITGATAEIGGVSCTSPTVNSSTQLTCTTGAHSAATVSARIANPDGQVSGLGGSFTYQAAPTVTSVTPYLGSISGGTSLTITGTEFLSGVSVSIGGVNCGSVSVSSPTSITCTSGAHASGSVNVVVTNFDAQAGARSPGFHYRASDSWTATSTTNAPSHRYGAATVWTGSKMIVWGGYDGGAVVNTGGIYDPFTDTWTSMSTTSAPSSRRYAQAVWTGSKMIVWGGYNGGVSGFATGGIYDPELDSWTAMSTTSAPSGRAFHSMVWTGSKAIVWGGINGATVTNTGGVYDLDSDTWTSTSTASAHTAGYGHTATWTGTQMLVLGGRDTTSFFGGIGTFYNPTGNSWSSYSPTGGSFHSTKSRAFHTAVWTGSEIIYWGGEETTGGTPGTTNDSGFHYNPTSNAISTMGGGTWPDPRYDHSAHWTGTQMLMFGGRSCANCSTLLNSGGSYASQAWTTMSSTGAPEGRVYHSSVWTGSEMIVWGGLDSTTNPLGSGGRYVP